MKSTLLRAAFGEGRVLVTAGAYDALSAIVAARQGFDAVWLSGLSVSAAHGLPDAGLVTMTEVLEAARVVNRSTALPVLADCDTGFGDANVVQRVVREFEAAGIAAVCFEDKQHPKRNSYREGNRLVEPAEFAAKLEAAVRARNDPAFMLVCRLESLIVGESVEQAVRRGLIYADAGGDALLVHSKASSGLQVFEFAARWRQERPHLPIIVVPTTYGDTTLAEFASGGVQMVIYANHSIRAALRAIGETLQSILVAGASSPVESRIASLKELFDLVDSDAVDCEDENAAKVSHR